MPSRAESPPPVCVVADDLSGAADTAVQFLREGEEILLLGLGDQVLLPQGPTSGGLAIDTQTRGASPAETLRRVHRAADLVRRSGAGFVYHKVDSQLRGRPGLEVETLRRELHLRCALVAPAHPDEGRVTSDGVHLVHGVPAAEGEAGRDPVAPVTNSRLPELLALQSGIEVAHVRLPDLEGGPAVLRHRLEALLAQGHRLITFDATSPGHLRSIAEVATSRFPDVLLAGSAGLAGALAALRRRGAAPPAAPIPACASMLLVCGSATVPLRRQVAMLLESGRCRGVMLTPASLEDEEHLGELRRRAGEAWQACDLVLQAPEERLAAATAPAAILGALAGLAMALARRRKPDAVLLSGGDTARAVLAAAGVSAIGLRGEVIPGVAWGIAKGGALDGVTVLTRSGAFGGELDLLAVHRRCREDETA